MPNVLSTRDLVSRPDNMDESVLHTFQHITNIRAIVNCLCNGSDSVLFAYIAS